MNILNDNSHLALMGIQSYQLRGGEVTPPPDALPSLTQIRSSALNCSQCGLHKNRTNVVFGVGSESADVMFIGEAPGYHEDKQGEPFVGRAGQLLNEMLRAIDYKRDAVYIANVIKCRPHQNRDPRAEEIEACGHWLVQQIQLVQPKLIVALGRFAAQSLLGTDKPIRALRDAIHQYTPLNLPLLVSYHPAYLLRNPSDKKKALKDLFRLKSQLAHS